MLTSDSKEDLINLADKILQEWHQYSDPSVQILAETDGIPHHTITPIARKRDGQFELDLVLRDNQTSAEHPDGIYHPHKDVQHIKKENIGLIEVMGLAILPPRLKEEVEQVASYLVGEAVSVVDYLPITILIHFCVNLRFNLIFYLHVVMVFIKLDYQ